MELIDKLKEYIKVLEKARDDYAENYWINYWFGSDFFAGMEHSTQACINDLKRMIREVEEL